MTYKQKLQDPRWQRKRLEIMQRDNFTCVDCGSNTKTLHVHHIMYKKGLNPWDYKNDIYKTLCYDCHENEHGIKQPDTSVKIAHKRPSMSDLHKIRQRINNRCKNPYAMTIKDIHQGIDYYWNLEFYKNHSMTEKLDIQNTGFKFVIVKNNRIFIFNKFINVNFHTKQLKLSKSKTLSLPYGEYFFQLIANFNDDKNDTEVWMEGKFNVIKVGCKDI